MRERGPAVEIVPSLGMQVSAAVVLGVRVLALPWADLERELRSAAENNPALLVRESRPAGGGPAPEAVATNSAWEHLRRDLLAALPARLAPAGWAVLAAIDERGFLDPAELRDLPAGDRDDVLAALREVGPPGIGAATVEECLLLQLDAAPLGPDDRQLARRVLTDHAVTLAERGPDAVAAALGCRPDRLTALLARLARLLRPYPGLGEPGPGAAPRTPPPDLVLERAGDTVRVVVPEQERWVVEVAPDAPALAPGQLREARELADRVHRRWDLLARLGGLVAAEHAAALLAGSTAFGPLTQATAAERLRVHESTVSRAVRHRRVRLPDGRVVPLRSLFGTGHDARAAVGELVRLEPRPTDREIAAVLAGRGFRIARRTVTKYRLALVD